MREPRNDSVVSVTQGWRPCPSQGSDCTRWSDRAFAVWPIGSHPWPPVPQSRIDRIPRNANFV